LVPIAVVENAGEGMTAGAIAPLETCFGG